MIYRITICDLLMLTAVVAMGCGSRDSGPGVTLHTFEFGVVDPSGSLTPTKSVPFKLGGQYGYQLAVHSTSGSVRVKEVFDLPEPAPWNESKDVPAGIRLLGSETTNSGKTQVQQYEVECKDKFTVFTRNFAIVKDDPRGRHKFTIYLDDQLAEEVEFEVK